MCIVQTSNVYEYKYLHYLHKSLIRSCEEARRLRPINLFNVCRESDAWTVNMRFWLSRERRQVLDAQNLVHAAWPDNEWADETVRARSCVYCSDKHCIVYVTMWMTALYSLFVWTADKYWVYCAVKCNALCRPCSLHAVISVRCRYFDVGSCRLVSIPRRWK